VIRTCSRAAVSAVTSTVTAWIGAPYRVDAAEPRIGASDSVSPVVRCCSETTRYPAKGASFW
jgi:hypothetical protein